MHFWQVQRHQINHTGSLIRWNSAFVSENTFPMWEPPIQGGSRNRTQEACTSKAHKTIQGEAWKFHPWLSSKERATEIEAQYTKWENSHLVFPPICCPIEYSSLIDTVVSKHYKCITAIWIKNMATPSTGITCGWCSQHEDSWKGSMDSWALFITLSCLSVWEQLVYVCHEMRKVENSWLVALLFWP